MKKEESEKLVRKNFTITKEQDAFFREKAAQGYNISKIIRLMIDDYFMKTCDGEKEHD